MLVATIGFRAQPHKRAEVLDAIDEIVERMRKAAGCCRSRLLMDTDDPNVYALVSEWLSGEHADTFFNSRDFQIFRGIRVLLKDEPAIIMDEVHTRTTTLIGRTSVRPMNPQL